MLHTMKSGLVGPSWMEMLRIIFIISGSRCLKALLISSFRPWLSQMSCAQRALAARFTASASTSMSGAAAGCCCSCLLDAGSNSIFITCTNNHTNTLLDIYRIAQNKRGHPASTQTPANLNDRIKWKYCILQIHSCLLIEYRLLRWRHNGVSFIYFCIGFFCKLITIWVKYWKMIVDNHTHILLNIYRVEEWSRMEAISNIYLNN